jgi:DNA adenine methylase
MKLKTFIKWSGNKSRHLRHIIPYIPDDYNTYYEPFIGSGALFLKLQPKKWVINDVNKDLINVWENVKNNPEIIIYLFEKFGKEFKPMSKQKKIEYCRNITETIDKMPYNITRATIFMLMKFCVYMGNIIIKNKFYFMGLDLHISIQNRCFFLEKNNYNNLNKVAEYLNSSNGLILNKDYKEVLNKVKKDDFVFLDPPYVEDHDYGFNYNSGEKLDNKFIMELYKEVKKLDKKKVKWMMTQAETKEIKNIFKDYNIKKFQVYRPVNKSYVNELIIMNY